MADLLLWPYQGSRSHLDFLVSQTGGEGGGG